MADYDWFTPTQHDLAKGKLCTVSVMWDNEDGTMTTFTGTSKGFGYKLVSEPAEKFEVWEKAYVYGPDEVKMVLDIEMVPNPKTGKYGKIIREEIPEF